MINNCLPIVLLLSVCCCKTTNDHSNERVNNTDMSYSSDVVVIRDSFPMSNDFYGHEKEYLVSRNYIGFRYVNDQDTVVESPVFGFSPNVMKEIHSYGKDIIPYLINHIDMEQYGNPGFVYPYESNLGRVVLQGGPLGINYAYMIELILAKDSIEDNYVYEGGYSGWYEKIKPYKVYDYCTIIGKFDLSYPDVSEKMSFDNMKKIKSIYEKWWESNKGESLDSLRKNWREEGSPLQNSPFIWI